MTKMTQAIHSQNFQVDDVKRRVLTPASLRPLRGSLSSCLKILMTRVLVEEYYESCYMSTIMIGMRHCPHWNSAVAEGMKMMDGNSQDSHRSMFIIPLQCRIFEQGSEHFQQITLFIQVLDPKQVWRNGYYFVPPFVVSRTRDPDLPDTWRWAVVVVSGRKDPDPLD